MNKILTLTLVGLLYLPISVLASSLNPAILSYLLDDSNAYVQEHTSEFVLSGLKDEVSSIRLHVEGATNYEVKNLPSWVYLDNSSGDITMSPDGSIFGHQQYDLIITKNGQKSVMKKALRISLYKSLNTLAQEIRETPSIAAKPIGAQNTTTRGGGVQIITNADGLNHTAISYYYEDYNTNGRITAIDMATDTVKNVITEDEMIGEGWNGAMMVPLGNGRAMFAYNKSGFQEVSVYNTTTHKWDRNVATPPPTHRINVMNAITYSTGGQVFTLGVNPHDGTAHPTLLSIDPNTYETRFYGNIGEGGWFGQQVVADREYVYVLTGRDPYRITQVRISDGQQTPIATGYDLWTRQYKGGVLLGWGGKSYFMYHGVKHEILTGQTASSDAPWPHIEGECAKRACYNVDYDILPINTFDSSAVIPLSGKSTGYYWYQAVYKGEWKKVTTPNIPLYPVSLIDMKVLPEVNKVIYAGDRYSGYVLQDLNTNAYDAYNPVSGTPSYYASDYSYPYLTMTGYPNGQTLVYDVRKKWDNTIIGASYHPETKVVTSNPRNLGHMNKTSGNHKNFTVVTGNDGLLYFAGRWMRDGVGSGVEWYNLANDEEGGLRAGFEDTWITQMKAVGKYIALGCSNGDGFQIRMFNTETKKVEYTIVPDSKISRVGYWTNYGDENILIYTRADDTGIAGLLNVNVITKEVVYNKNLGVATSVGVLSNEKDNASIFMKDGFAYINAGGAILRIEPDSGNADVALNYAGYLGRFQAYQNRLFTSIKQSYELPFDMKWGFESADKREVIAATKIGAGNGNLVFTTESTTPFNVDVTLDHRADNTILNPIYYDNDALNGELNVKMSLCMTIESISGSDVIINAIEYNGNDTAHVVSGESKYVEFSVSSYQTKDSFKMHFAAAQMDTAHFKLKDIHFKKEIILK